MFQFVRRTLADRIAPTAASWRSAADIDAASLAPALGVAATSITDVSVAAVDHGTSQRSEVVVRSIDGTETRLFVKNTAVRLGARALNAGARLCEREAAFYETVAPHVAAAPQALVSRWDPKTGRSTVVLPDLVAAGYEFRPGAEPCTVAEAELALAALAELHAAEVPPAASIEIFASDTRTQRRMSRLACRAVGRVPKSLRALVPQAVQDESRTLAVHAAAFAPALDAFPQAFIHNDTHRGNIGFSPTDAVLVDWQNCGRGPALKDVAYLLSTSLEPEDRRRHERDLLDHYRCAVADRGGTPPSAEDAWDAYRVLLVTGYIAAAVTALFRNRLQAAANAEAGLRRASAAVGDLDSFAALRHHIATATTSPRRAP